MAPCRNMWPGRGPCLSCQIMGVRFLCSDTGWQAGAMVAKAAGHRCFLTAGKVGLNPWCGGQFMRSLPRRERPDWRPERILILIKKKKKDNSPKG